jgi:inner membrane protein
MVYRLSKNKSLYFSDLRFGLWQPENPQFAFSYEFITTESELKAVEVQKSKRDGKRLLLQIANRLKGN